METLLQQIINGVTLGSIYALIALGFTVTFGVLGLLNLAHGEIYMVGAYVGLVLLMPAKLNPLLAALSTLILIFFLGVVERVAFKPLRRSAHFIPLISTIAVGLIVQEVVLLLKGPQTQFFPEILKFNPVALWRIRIFPLQIIILVVGLLLMAAFHIFLKKAKMGKAIRATTQDNITARLMGISTDRVISVTFGAGPALGAAAGILVGIFYGAIYPTMGYMATLKAFVAAVVGGMGSIPGAVIGGFFLGIGEGLGAAYLPSGFSDVIAFALLIAFLVIKPGGFLGMAAEKMMEVHAPLPSGRALRIGLPPFLKGRDLVLLLLILSLAFSLRPYGPQYS